MPVERELQRRCYSVEPPAKAAYVALATMGSGGPHVCIYSLCLTKRLNPEHLNAALCRPCEIVCISVLVYHVAAYMLSLTSVLSRG